MVSVVDIIIHLCIQIIEIKNVISNRWLERNDRYSETRNNQATDITEKKIEMYRMGG